MKLVSNLTQIALQAENAAKEALRQTGEDIASLASQLAPVDTGKLRDSYRSEQISDTEVWVGSDVEYAPYVEFGTSRQEAQPHLTPAFHQSEETFKANLIKEIEKLG